MTAFTEFRLWLRRGPVQEKKAAAMATVVTLVLVAWALVPTGEDESRVEAVAFNQTGLSGASGSEGEVAAESGAPVGDTGAAAGGAGGPGGTARGAVAGTASATRGGATAAAGSSADCGELKATDKGVTAKEILIGVSVADVAGANETLGVATPEEQKAIVEAVLDPINKAGGIKCRKVVVKAYPSNPFDQASQRSACLGMVADGVFATVSDGGFFPTSQRQCLPQHGIPVFGTYGALTSEIKNYAPLIFSLQAQMNITMRNWVFGARDHGFFDGAKGFKKLGIWATDCDPEVNQEVDGYLDQVGISGGKVTKFVGSCPLASQTPPNQCAQAAIDFRNSGVSHVFLNGGGNPNRCFVNAAAQQGFVPKYSSSDYVLGVGSPDLGTSYNGAAFDNTLGITTSRTGEINSGLPPAPGTLKCNELLKAKGLRPIATEADRLIGLMCDVTWMFTAAAAKAPRLTRDVWGVGWAATGPIEFAYPNADSGGGSSRVGAADFWRVAVWKAQCNCWKVADPTFRPSFK